VEATLLVSMELIPAVTIVPERGGRVSELRHCGLAGRSHGPYRDSVSDRE